MFCDGEGRACSWLSAPGPLPNQEEVMLACLWTPQCFHPKSTPRQWGNPEHRGWWGACRVGVPIPGSKGSTTYYITCADPCSEGCTWGNWLSSPFWKQWQPWEDGTIGFWFNTVSVVFVTRGRLELGTVTVKDWNYIKWICLLSRSQISTITYFILKLAVIDRLLNTKDLPDHKHLVL